MLLQILSRTFTLFKSVCMDGLGFCAGREQRHTIGWLPLPGLFPQQGAGQVAGTHSWPIFPTGLSTGSLPDCLTSSRATFLGPRE